MSDDVRRTCDGFLRQDGNRLNLFRHTLQTADAHYVANFVETHSARVETVLFHSCVFTSEQVIRLLTDGFANAVRKRSMKICVELKNDGVHPTRSSIRDISHFGALIELATRLNLQRFLLDDSDFAYVADHILEGTGKQNLQELWVNCYPHRRSAVSVAATTARLVRESSLKILYFLGHCSISVEEAWGPLCRVLKEDANATLERLHLWQGSYGVSKVERNREFTRLVDMLVDVLMTNSTLIHLDLGQNRASEISVALATRRYMKRHLQPLLRRNQQLRQVQSAIQSPVRFNTGDGFWRFMQQNCPSFVQDPDGPELSALYMALRNVTVGHRGEADLLVLSAVDALRSHQQQQQG